MLQPLLFLIGLAGAAFMIYTFHVMNLLNRTARILAISGLMLLTILFGNRMLAPGQIRPTPNVFPFLDNASVSPKAVRGWQETPFLILELILAEIGNLNGADLPESASPSPSLSPSPSDQIPTPVPSASPSPSISPSSPSPVQPVPTPSPAPPQVQPSPDPYPERYPDDFYPGDPYPGDPYPVPSPTPYPTEPAPTPANPDQPDANDPNFEQPYPYEPRPSRPQPKPIPAWW